MSAPRQISKILNLANLETNTITASIDSDIVNQTVTLGVTLPVGTISVSSADTLPLSNIQIGQQGFVTTTNRLYIYNGSGWYNIATINSTPYWVTEANASYTLNTDGTATVVEINAADSDGTIVSYTATGDSDFNLIATVVQDSDGRFVIRSIDSENSASPTAGSGILTFRASDGVDQASTASTFSLTFNVDWATDSITETKFQPSDIVNGARFGYRNVGISGNGLYVIAGAPNIASNYGKGYVFFYNGSNWVQQADITNPDNNATNFAGKVAINGDGNVAIFGQEGYNSYAGAAHVYTRSGTTWTHRARLTASDAAANDSFAGYVPGGSTISVSKDGTYIIVGAQGEDTNGAQAGSSYIYTGSGSSWTEQAILRSPGVTASDQFGYSVKINIDGTYAIIGSPGAGPGTFRGSAYVYTRSGSTWSLQAQLSASDQADQDNLGQSVTISADGMYAAAGARYDDDSYDSSGSVYVFVRSGSTWSQQQKINLGNSGAIYNYFGSSIDMNEAGDLLLIGSGGENTNQIGKARLYKRTGSTWALIKTIEASDDADTTGSGNITGFAQKVALSGNGNAVAVSAYPDTDANTRGSVYVFNA
jgi:hypothetical protein